MYPSTRTLVQYDQVSYLTANRSTEKRFFVHPVLAKQIIVLVVSANEAMIVRLTKVKILLSRLHNSELYQ